MYGLPQSIVITGPYTILWICLVMFICPSLHISFTNGLQVLACIYIEHILQQVLCIQD